MHLQNIWTLGLHCLFRPTFFFQLLSTCAAQTVEKQNTAELSA